MREFIISIVVFFVLAIPVIFNRKKMCTPKRYGVLAVLTPAFWGIATAYIILFYFVPEYFLPIIPISTVVFVLAGYIYILAHIKPIDKTDEKYAEYSERKLSYTAAKRMIKVGVIGEIFYILLYILLLVIVAMGVIFLVCLFGGTFEDVAEWLIALFYFLFSYEIPLGVCCMLGIILESAFVTHGCIKFIIRQNYSLIKKILLITLSLIPLINIIYGICLIKKIKVGLTSDNT